LDEQNTQQMLRSVSKTVSSLPRRNLMQVRIEVERSPTVKQAEECYPSCRNYARVVNSLTS